MALRVVLALTLAVLVSAEPAVAGSPSPSLGRTAVVNTVSGTVLVKDRGDRRFSRLPGSATVVRTGAILNATNGRVRVRTSSGAGLPQNNGVFSQGAFTISQARQRGAVTDLRLRGGKLGTCGTSARASGLAGRRLKGDAKGRFRTRGRYSAATVRGTQWLVEDRCDGTRTTAERGSVQTDSNGALEFTLDPGDVTQYFCDFDGQEPISQAFCTVVLNRPADGVWGGGIVNLGDATSYVLCLDDPTGARRCANLPFSQPDSNGLRQSAIVCTTDRGPGDYSLRWFISDQQLGLPLSFTSTTPPTEMVCIADPPPAGP